MSGDPHADRVEAGRHQVGQSPLPCQDEGEGPRPEALGEQGHARIHVPGALPAGDAANLLRTRDVDDEGIEGRAGLDLEHAGDRRRVERIGAQAVDGLGGEGYDAARFQQARGFGNGGRIVGREDPSRQTASGAPEPIVRPPCCREASMPQAAWMSGPPE